MVELRIQPTVRLVTSRTVGFAVHLKLTCVLVQMTSIAIAGKSGKLLNPNTLRILGIMAVPASNLGMLAVQLEARPIVVEMNRPPIGFVVAIQAIRLGIEFFRNETLMFAFVAI